MAQTGGQIAIAVDGVVHSAPKVEEAVTGGQAQITGNLDQATAQTLAAILQSGALPVALNVSGVATA